MGKERSKTKWLISTHKINTGGKSNPPMSKTDKTIQNLNFRWKKQPEMDYLDLFRNFLFLNLWNFSIFLVFFRFFYIFIKNFKSKISIFEDFYLIFHPHRQCHLLDIIITFMLNSFQEFRLFKQKYFFSLIKFQKRHFVSQKITIKLTLMTEQRPT